MAELCVKQIEDSYWLCCASHRIKCVVGAAGCISAEMKREGDSATPMGRWPLRGLYFRPDRISLSRLSSYSVSTPIALTTADGWCDDPEDSHYNQPVTLPYQGRHERLWRDDGLYDIIIPLGYNDVDPVPHKGSAIFLHCAMDDTVATKGCVGLPADALIALLGYLTKDSYVTI